MWLEREYPTLTQKYSGEKTLGNSEREKKLLNRQKPKDRTWPSDTIRSKERKKKTLSNSETTEKPEYNMTCNVMFQNMFILSYNNNQTPYL